MKRIRFIFMLYCLFLSVPAWSQNTGCSDIPGFAGFNFWVGEWEVFDNNTGNKVGENSIQPMESGCLLLESWASIDGGTGTSMNCFNPVTGEWRQLWVSAGRYAQKLRCNLSLRNDKSLNL